MQRNQNEKFYFCSTCQKNVSSKEISWKRDPNLNAPRKQTRPDFFGLCQCGLRLTQLAPGQAHYEQILQASTERGKLDKKVYSEEEVE